MRRRIWAFLTGIFVTSISFVLAPPQAFACWPDLPDSAAEALGRTQVAFIGRVTAAEYRSTTFEVATVLNGKVGSKAVIHNTGSSCDEEFASDQWYMVFSNRSNAQPEGLGVPTPNFANLTSNITQLYSDKNFGSTPLDSEHGREFTRELGQNNLIAFMLALGSISIATAASVVWARRRRKAQLPWK
jgi:hypothetical protein